MPEKLARDRRMFEISRSEERLTIADGNARLAAIGAGVVTIVAGSGMIGCGLLTDFINAAPYREAGLPHRPDTTIAFAIVTLLLALVLLLLSQHTEIVVDKSRGTLRLVSVRPFRTSVLREVALASVRRARIVGSRGAFWQLEFELDSDQPLAPPALQSDAYEPDELRRIADQINQFLAAT